jgi:hypothetical protein
LFISGNIYSYLKYGRKRQNSDLKKNNLIKGRKQRRPWHSRINTGLNNGSTTNYYPIKTTTEKENKTDRI